MSKKAVVPDAWDDDWVTNADQPTVAIQTPQTEVKISKAERRAKQAELNRKLWEEAEAPKDPYFVQTRHDVPLKCDFKPAVKVLSRKPTPSVANRTDSSGLEKLALDDEDDDEEENEVVKRTMTIEERQMRAQKEREEKQKKYEEVRQRLFGATDTATNGSPSSSFITPPSNLGDGKSKGKNRGGRDSRPTASVGSSSRQLYDPNYTVKPDSVYIQKKEAPGSDSGRSTPSEERPIRAPRGPDGSGRGGFGFASRGR